MGSKERRERERGEQRQRILEAALAILTKEGYPALSMRKLAERIEYSAAAIYLHFKSREQIAQELSEQAFGHLLGSLEGAVGGGGGVSSLEPMSLAYVRFGLQHPELYRLIFMSDSEYMRAAFGKEPEGSAGQRAYALLLQMAEEMQAEGLATDATGKEVADLVWMTLHGIVSLHLACVTMPLSSPERMVSLAVGALVRGWGPSAALRMTV